MVKAREAKRARALTSGKAVHAEGTDPESAAAPPAIILVNPQLGENIGFAARAMANFGLTDLRLVGPRDGWPNDKAHAAAAGAAFLVERASVYDSVESAIGGLNYVLASTARPREMVKPVLSPESSAVELRRRGQNAEHCGVLFGPERSGLDNDTISLADAILTAPVSPDFASLSLPQAVLLFGYEWFKANSVALSLGRATACDGPATEGIAFPDTPATREELLGLFSHLEAELDRTGFLFPPEKRPSMVRAIRNMFHRMGATEQDVRTWRGIVASLSRKHAPRGKKVS
jgi:tRNA/rRNA methyltransferase